MQKYNVWFRQNKDKQILWFTEQLFILYTSGIGFATSLNLLQQACPFVSLRLKIVGLIHAVQHGQPLSQALRQYPEYFDSFYITLIQAGEESGKLIAILKELQVFWRLKEQVKADLIQAFTYPGMILLMILLLSFGLCFAVIPQFEAVFKSFQVPLPWPTQVLFGSVNFIKTHFWLLLLFGLSCLGLSIKVGPSLVIHLKKDLRLFKIPIIGSFYHVFLLLWFFKIMHLSTQAGLSLQNSVQLLKPIFQKTPLALFLKGMQYDLHQGEKLSVIFARRNYFPPICESLMSIAEETGTLDEQFFRLSDLFSQQFTMQIQRCKILLEPCLMLIMGLFVGGMVLAIYYPIFSIGGIV